MQLDAGLRGRHKGRPGAIQLPGYSAGVSVCAIFKRVKNVLLQHKHPINVSGSAEGYATFARQRLLLMLTPSVRPPLGWANRSWRTRARGGSRGSGEKIK